MDLLTPPKKPPPIPNKNLKPSIFQTATELMKKTKKGSKTLGEFFSINKTSIYQIQHPGNPA